MPADMTISRAPSPHHGDASRPYHCSSGERPPTAAWSIDFGYCRHSLDALVGAHDPRCPAACPHKAPFRVMAGFTKQFAWRGAADAAAWARNRKKEQR